MFLNNTERTVLERLRVVAGAILAVIGVGCFTWGAFASSIILLLIGIGVILLGIFIARSHALLAFIHDLLSW